MWRSKERKGFGIRQISVQILAHYPWSLFSLTGSSWRHQAFMEILLKLIIPNISCYIGSYHGELFRPVLVRTVPAAETKNPQLLMAYYKTGLFSPWDIVWLDVFSGLSWKGIQTFSTLGVFPWILCWLERKRRHLMDMSGGGTCHFLPHFIGQTQSHNHNLTQGRMAIIDSAVPRKRKWKGWTCGLLVLHTCSHHR